MRKVVVPLGGLNLTEVHAPCLFSPASVPKQAKRVHKIKISSIFLSKYIVNQLLLLNNNEQQQDQQQQPKLCFLFFLFQSSVFTFFFLFLVTRFYLAGAFIFLLPAITTLYRRTILLAD